MSLLWMWRQKSISGRTYMWCGRNDIFANHNIFICYRITITSHLSLTSSEKHIYPRKSWKRWYLHLLKPNFIIIALSLQIMFPKETLHSWWRLFGGGQAVDSRLFSRCCCNDVSSCRNVIRTVVSRHVQCTSEIVLKQYQIPKKNKNEFTKSRYTKYSSSRYIYTPVHSNTINVLSMNLNCLEFKFQYAFNCTVIWYAFFI